VKVLVKEKIADAGVDLLRSQFDVDLGLEMSDEELREKIAQYDAILIRSATKMTPELIDLADNLKVIGRAGTGVDNVDIPAAGSSSPTRRNRTRSPPPSTPWRWRSPSSATSRRRTNRSSPAAGTGPSSRAPSSTARRSG
jgi:hypothetical protein